MTTPEGGQEGFVTFAIDADEDDANVGINFNGAAFTVNAPTAEHLGLSLIKAAEGTRYARAVIRALIAADIPEATRASVLEAVKQAMDAGDPDGEHGPRRGSEEDLGRMFGLPDWLDPHRTTPAPDYREQDAPPQHADAPETIIVGDLDDAGMALVDRETGAVELAGDGEHLTEKQLRRRREALASVKARFKHYRDNIVPVGPVERF